MRGRESQTIYTPRSRVDQEHAQRASSEAARNELKGGSPKKKVLPSPPQSLLLIITIDLHFFKLSPAVYRNPSPIPPAPAVLVKCCFFSQNGSVQGNKGCFKVSQIWSQSSGFKRRFHRRHLSSSSSVRLSYVRSLRVQPGEKFFLHCLNEFIPKLFCPRTHNDQVYQLQSYEGP